VTQLQNQDPLQPLQDRELIAQLAQLSTLDALQSIQQLTEQGQFVDQLSQAAALIGRTVSAKSGDSTVSGKVTAATVQADKSVMLTVDNHQVGISDLVSVTNP